MPPDTEPEARMAEPDPQPVTKLATLEVERLLIRELGGGRVRAVLETAMEPSAEGEPAVVPRVRLSLLAPNGDVALRLEVDDAGEPRVYVGRPGGGVAAILSRDSLDLWAGGNVVASLMAQADGGVLELGDGAAKVVVRLPAEA
jgi:hypothetical protein